jgi:sulfur-oxidizing protein SoxY
MGLAMVGGLAGIGDARATPETAMAWLQKLAPGTPRSGRVAITAPEIAENGNSVPVTVFVESPMTEADYVNAVHVAAEGNPNPGVGTFRFVPDSGRAEVQFRIRLAGTQRLIAVAALSDGSLWTASREVKVTIGGCGG